MRNQNGSSDVAKHAENTYHFITGYYEVVRACGDAECMTARCRILQGSCGVRGCCRAAAAYGRAGMPTGTEEEAVTAARELMKRGPMGYVLIKRGAAGSLLITGA